MKKAMNKLLLVLASFIGARTFMIAIGNYTEGALASFVSCLVYAVLYILFRNGNDFKKGSQTFSESFITVLLFVCANCFISMFLGIIFEIESVKISLLQGIVSAVLVPLCEELFFRATLFKTLDSVVPTPFAIIFSSLIFALSHAGLPSIISAFIFGCLLSIIYKKQGSIIVPVACHTANNLLAVLLTLKGF